jgi:hypothetical protein
MTTRALMCFSEAVRPLPRSHRLILSVLSRWPPAGVVLQFCKCRTPDWRHSRRSDRLPYPVSDGPLQADSF